MDDITDKLCYVEGTIIELINNNPFTKAKTEKRKWRILLKNVIVSRMDNYINPTRIWMTGEKIWEMIEMKILEDYKELEHIWVTGCRKIIRLRNSKFIGKKVKLMGRLKLYGCERILASPLRILNLEQNNEEDKKTREMIISMINSIIDE
jgi:hypothetical protein